MARPVPETHITDLDARALRTGCLGSAVAVEPSATTRPEPDEFSRPNLLITVRRRADVLVTLGGLLVGLSAAGISGHAVAVPVGFVAVLSVRAGVTDARTLRIPNLLVLIGLVAVAVGALLVSVVDHRSSAYIVAAISAGLLLGGAPMLFGLWLVRPTIVGGGDWKFLSAQSTAIGLLAPYAAPLILLGGAVGGLFRRVSRGQSKDAPLAPGLAVGYLAAVVAALMFHQLLGGAYT